MKTFLLLCILGTPTLAVGNLIISEVMKDPTGSEIAMPGGKSHEYVELTNIGTDTVDVTGMYLTDGDEVDSIIAWVTPVPQHPQCHYGSTRIPPGSCAVVLDWDYATGAAIQPYIIDTSTLILTTTDMDIGDGLSESDGIVLFKGAKNRIDSVIAVFGDSLQAISISSIPRQEVVAQIEGVSCIPQSPFFSPANYGYCPSGTSIGRYESCTKGFLFDSKLTQESASSAVCSLACVVMPPCSLVTLSIVQYQNNNASTITGGPAQCGINLLQCKLPFQSTRYALKATSPVTEVEWDLDISPLWVPPGAMCISEIFAAGTDSIPEWFEVFNTSDMPLSLNNWHYGSAANPVLLTSAIIQINPGSYAIVTADKPRFVHVFPGCTANVVQPPVWQSLDNYDDTLALISGPGSATDTAYYHNEWFSGFHGQVLARISYCKSGTDPTAWVLASRESPGESNPDSIWRSGTLPTVDVGPTPFTPNGDRSNDALFITVDLPAASTISVSIYGFSGKKYKDWSATQAHQYIWDGKTSTGALAPVGPFFVVAEITTYNSKNVIRKKGVLWR